MTKKDYLIKLMEALSTEVLPIAPNLLALLENDAMGDELIDVFYNMFHEYALTVKDEKSKKQIDASLSFLEKLKAAEVNEQKQDQKDIEDLEDMLENI
jgi:hypothetical protein